MKKAIIFDLDNCLAPATAVGLDLYEPAFEAVRRANRGALARERQFVAFFIDAIDEEPRIRKLGHCRHILAHYDLAASDVLVVGDDADSEIDAGNRLATTTVQTLRPWVASAANASCSVRSLAELRPLLGG